MTTTAATAIRRIGLELLAGAAATLPEDAAAGVKPEETGVAIGADAGATCADGFDAGGGGGTTAAAAEEDGGGGDCGMGVGADADGGGGTGVCAELDPGVTA